MTTPNGTRRPVFGVAARLVPAVGFTLDLEPDHLDGSRRSAWRRVVCYLSVPWCGVVDTASVLGLISHSVVVEHRAGTAASCPCACGSCVICLTTDAVRHTLRGFPARLPMGVSGMLDLSRVLVYTACERRAQAQAASL